MHLHNQGPTQLAAPAVLPLVAGRLLFDPGSLVAGMGELLLARSLKVAAVLLGAVVLNRLVRWLLRRLVGGLEHRFVQNRLESLRAKTPRALLASTDPVLSLSAQQMVRDFLSGIAMLMEDQYGPGDVIDAGPAKGVVERVGLRTTRLRAVDGIV